MTDGKPAAHRHDASEPSSAGLSPELASLVDPLAAHVHDAWMRVRVREGWSYAPERDDARRTHPCLVPFDQLSEADKDCDREVTRATLLAMQALGFDIVKRG
jgi:hypothetical protein